MAQQNAVHARAQMSKAAGGEDTLRSVLAMLDNLNKTVIARMEALEVYILEW